MFKPGLNDFNGIKDMDIPSPLINTVGFSEKYNELVDKYNKLENEKQELDIRQRKLEIENAILKDANEDLRTAIKILVNRL